MLPRTATVLCFLTFGFAVNAAELRLQLQPTNVVAVMWPTNDPDFTLQMTDQLPATNGWPAFPRVRGTNGPDFRIEDGSAVPARFFRLYNGGPPQPPQLSVSGPTTVTLTNPQSVTLTYADANGDLALLAVTINGTNRSLLPTALLNMGGTNGQIQLPIDANQLPFGTATYGFQLTDLHSLTSSVESLTFTVSGVGGGGTAPGFAFVASGVSNIIARPFSPTDRYRPRVPVTYSDPDSDLHRVKLRIISPGNVTNLVEETAAALGMTGSSGTGTVAVLTFSNTSLLGQYTLELSGVDRNGNASPVASRSLILTNFGVGEYQPAFFGATPFTPTNGAAGTIVTLSGFGFDPVPSNNQVFLNDVAVEVLDSSIFSMHVKLVEGVESGPFVVRIAGGSAVMTSKSFRVPASVRVEAANPPSDENGNPASSVELAVGANLQFRARVVATNSGGDRTVDWFVNGAAGGNPTVGTINAGGLYVAPADVPTGGIVTVSAKLHNLPTVSGATNVVIVPAAVQPGTPVIVSAVKGGAVFARDFRASVRIPPGALSTNTTVTVGEPALAPTPSAGRRLLGFAEFLPSGATFNTPVQVTLPLKRVLPPGTSLPLRFYQPTNGTYVNEGITAIVTEAGDRAVASLMHFTIAVVDETNDVTSCIAPTLISIDPALMREGERRPLKLSGTALTTNLLVEVRNSDGSPTSDISVESFIAQGTQAGVLLKGATITNFDSGTRDYRLRVTCPAGGTAEIVFQVEGLPQLLVSSGQTIGLNDPAPMTVSGVQVAAGGRLAINSGELRVESLGDVQVDGVIDAGGAPGGNAVGQMPGQPGPLGHGGRGGLGRQDSDGLFNWDGAEPENFGQNANDAIGVSSPFSGATRPYGATDRFPQGTGGLPGVNYSPNASGVASIVAECLTIHGRACFESAETLFNVVASILGLDVGSIGNHGYGAVRVSALPATGGGGGGGGGMIKVNLGATTLPSLIGVDIDASFLTALSFQIRGGGGGAGGDGGRSISITTPGSILVGPAGRITAAGGKGGDGSRLSPGEISVSGFSLPPLPQLPANMGGGGGGGRGGNVFLTSGQAFQYQSYDQFEVRGGLSGLGGVLYLDPVNQVSRFQEALPAEGEGPGGRRYTHGPVFDPESLRPQVTDRLLLPIDFVSALPNQSAVLHVQGEAAGADITIRTDGSAFAHDGYLQLFPGHNTVSNRAVFPQRILVLANDADGDGLSDRDEADFGSNPGIADTDGDGLSDSVDVLSGGDPVRPDTDGDGLRDGDELALGTNLHQVDSDGDGLWDSAEALLGSGPTNAASLPQQLTAGLLFSSASHPGTSGGAYLMGIERNTGNIGLFGRPATGFNFGLTFDHYGQLYISDGQFLRIYDPLAQTNFTVGEFDPVGHAIQCGVLAFNPLKTDRSLYGVALGGPPNFDQTGQLLRIDRHTGQAVLVGTPLAQRYHSLAFTRSGTLYAALENSGSPDSLVQIDPTNGSILQVIGSTGVTNVTGLVVPGDQTLVGALRAGTQTSFLLSLDTTNGAATATVPVVAQLQDLAVAPCPVPCLQPAVTNAGWPKPTKLKAIDFDKDGKDDLVLLAERSAGAFGTSVAFFHSGANGILTRQTNYLISSTFTVTADELAVGDFNGDTWPDVVTQNPYQALTSIAIFTNDGGGSFPAPVIAPALIEPLSIAVGDLNGDGAPDLLTAGAGTVIIRSGDGAGGFTNGPALPLDPERFYLYARFGDVNGDSLPDIVAMDSAVTTTFTNAGGGVFPTRLEFNYAYESGDFEMADFDQDGLDDVLVRDWSDIGGFVRFRSQGNGYFDPPVLHSYPQPGASRIDDFAVGDLDQDGLPDLVFTDSTLGKLNIWMNDGGGVFRPMRPQTFNTGALPYAVAIGDFNGDSIPDIGVGNRQNGGLLILLQE